MNPKELCSMVDHTLLKQTATWEEIQKLCDEAIAYGTASVCIPPCYVAKAHQYVQGRMTICTVSWMATASSLLERTRPVSVNAQNS